MMVGDANAPAELFSSGTDDGTTWSGVDPFSMFLFNDFLFMGDILKI